MINTSNSIFNSSASFNANSSLISVEDAKAYADQLITDLGLPYNEFAPPCYAAVTIDASGKIIIQGLNASAINRLTKLYPEIYPGAVNDFGDDILWEVTIVLSPESSELVCDYAVLGAERGDYSKTFQIEYLGYPTGSSTK